MAAQKSGVALLASSLVLLGESRSAARQKYILRDTSSSWLDLLASFLEFAPLARKASRRLVRSGVDALSQAAPKLRGAESPQALFALATSLVARKPALYRLMSTTTLVSVSAARQIYATQSTLATALLITLISAFIVRETSEQFFDHFDDRNSTLYVQLVRAANIASFATPDTLSKALYLSTQAAIVTYGALLPLFDDDTCAGNCFSPDALRQRLQSFLDFDKDTRDERVAALSLLAVFFALYRVKLASSFRISIPGLLSFLAGLLFLLGGPFLNPLPDTETAESLTYAHFLIIFAAFLVGGTPFFLSLLGVVSLLLRRHNIDIMKGI